jgi:hypothetical protein
MNINFETPNIILVMYPNFAGGKFLINCLGLSDDAVLQNQDFAKKQLIGKFSQQDKINYIFDKLEKHKPNLAWNDLGLGCRRLFNYNYLNYASIDSLDINNFNDVVMSLSQGNKKFFHVGHNFDNLVNFRNIWKNSKIILFKNTPTFRKLRLGGSKRPNLNSTWDNKADSFFVDRDFKKNMLCTFDNNVYLNEEKTLNEVKKIYDILNLSGFNEQAISEYYRKWIKICIQLDRISLNKY